MSFRTLNAQGILSSDVPTGNLLWVDQVNGVDKLATRGRLTIPFGTLTAAKNAAQSGDTIMVMPGEYHEDTLFKAGVNWHFLSGARVVGQSAVDALFPVTAGTTRITGDGEFEAGAASHVLRVNHASADVTFKARRLKGNAAALRVDNGVSVDVEADIIEATGAAGSPVDIRGGNLRLEARLISCESYSAVYAIGGEATLKAHRVFSEDSYALLIAGGKLTAQVLEVHSDDGVAVGIGSGTCLLSCMSLRSATGVAIQMNGGTLFIEGAKIFGVGEDSMILLGADGLTLRNCWIYAEAPASIGTTESAQSCRVVSSISNASVDVNTTQLTNSQLIVDAGVTD